MDPNASRSTEAGGGMTPAQIVAFTTAAAATAAVVGLATYVYLQRRSSATPQQFLERCRETIDLIERGLDSGHA